MGSGSSIPAPDPTPSPPATSPHRSRPHSSASLCPQTTQVPVESCEDLVADLSLVTLCLTLWKKTLHGRGWQQELDCTPERHHKGLCTRSATSASPLFALHQQWKHGNLGKEGGDRGMGWPCHKRILLCPLRCSKRSKVLLHHSPGMPGGPVSLPFFTRRPEC